MDGLDRREPLASRSAREVLTPQGRALLLVFEALERAAVCYCVTHGYEDYPQCVGASDVDILVSPEWRPSELAALISAAVRPAGGELAGWWGGYMVLAGRCPGSAPWFLALDFRTAYALGHLCFYTAEEVLGGRRRCKAFWIPAPDIEFACRLVRRIAKRDLDAAQAARLSLLYRHDPAGCRRQLARFWRPRPAALIESAAGEGRWEMAIRSLAALRGEARRRAFMQRPVRAIAGMLRRMRRRAQLLWSPEGGLSLVLLGPDGAGKSSLANALTAQLRPAFSASRRASFPPALLRRLHRARESAAPRPPHELAPRSPPMSAVRAVCYWSVHHLLFLRISARLQAARSVLTVHDRHLVDALVDPWRYRYGGAMRLLRAICRLGSRPDLVILLDAPAEVLQSRKQEVPFAETARQCEAYRALVGAMKNGHIVDAGRPLEDVAAAVGDIVLRTLSARIAARLARRQRGPRHSAAALAAAQPSAPISTAEP